LTALVLLTNQQLGKETPAHTGVSQRDSLPDFLRTEDNPVKMTPPESFLSMSRALAIFVVVSGLVANLSGQVTSGEILGSVRDPSGAGVTDAKIAVRNLETSATREAMTEPDGSFRFPQLP
jgi:hypothetical protein